jgi:hypothetical protein
MHNRSRVQAPFGKLYLLGAVTGSRASERSSATVGGIPTSRLTFRWREHFATFAAARGWSFAVLPRYPRKHAHRDLLHSGGDNRPQERHGDDVSEKPHRADDPGDRGKQREPNMTTARKRRRNLVAERLVIFDTIRHARGA